ncbi:alkaline phosphatase family protein [Phototrophicus methaneseepsis]|uniref:Alkaline phosphatase family protein n=1 Tax=Phototrophicus methaneseepsis TaxID=2710758 RepID=A0A7S8IFW9_9CHLR|nr:alkaline phosphatase family protein [Phototrophicus methaneseepsis]QPC84046.1 alkaline phosphatase family protein [Phototrophicus methaneseepsis]
MMNPPETPPVIFIMTDGVRPDAIATANTPALDQLKQRGAYTMQAQSVVPSITLPCHMSIFNSVPPSRHGILENHYHPLARPVTGLVEHLHRKELRSGMYYNWDFLRDVCRPGYLHTSFYVNTAYNINGDEIIVDHACEAIAANMADFHFVYLGTADTVGHAMGWMSDMYLLQVEMLDSLIGRVLEAAPTQSHILVHSDHGGHERDHGTEMPEDMTIPWFLVGPSVRQNYEVQQPVSLLDTAPTIAALFGLPSHRDWEGQPVTEAFINQGDEQAG